MELGDLSVSAPNLEHLVISSSGRFKADVAGGPRISEFSHLRHAYAGGALIKSENRGS